MANRIRKGDTVLVIAGSSRGQVSEVTKIEGDRAFLKDVNLQSRHIKKTRDESGRIEMIPGSIHLSNLSHVDENGKASKVAFVIKTEGERKHKSLVLKTTGKEIRKV